MLAMLPCNGGDDDAAVIGGDRGLVAVRAHRRRDPDVDRMPNGHASYVDDEQFTFGGRPADERAGRAVRGDGGLHLAHIVQTVAIPKLSISGKILNIDVKGKGEREGSAAD